MSKIQLAKYIDCTGCGACKASCAKDAILFDYDENGHLRPSINHSTCVQCGQCQKHCPVLNDNKLIRHNPFKLKTYTAWTNNNDLCLKSTSGGIFAQVAIDFINNKHGYVYGVMLSDHNTCEHIEINKVDDINKIVGTKYIQSDASNVYKSIKHHLLHSEPCLFSGTPCQIAGLYTYLQNITPENLYTIELICHGVPSKYITDLACKYYGADHILSYRDKRDGWHKGYSCVYVKNDGQIIENQPREFFSRRIGIAERLSCYNCKYANISRLADLTIGDQWGLMSKYPERKRYGASLVICNTSKGEEMLVSDNISLDLNENTTLNAPTLFMPRNMIHITQWIKYIKKLPLKWQFIFVSLDYKKQPILGFVELYRRYRERQFWKCFRNFLNSERERLGWK